MDGWDGWDVQRFYLLFGAAFLLFGLQGFLFHWRGGAVNPSLTIEAIATRTARLALRERSAA